MKRVFSWFSGNKTYLAAIVLAVLGLLAANGVEVPTWVYTVLAAFGLYAGRHAIQKLDTHNSNEHKQIANKIPPANATADPLGQPPSRPDNN